MNTSLKLFLSGALTVCLTAPYLSLADGNHSSLLLMLISNKIKMEKMITAAEEDNSLCSQNSEQASKMMKTTLHMLSEYSKEKSGNYVNQSAYADSLEQRAKMIEKFSLLLERLFNLKQSC